MKKYLSFVLLFVFSVNNISGSPLVFKVSRELENESELIELGVFDSSKFKQLRIGTYFAPSVSTRAEQRVQIFAIEGNEEIFLAQNYEEMSFVLDSPPPKIKIKARARGKISVYIWGQ